MGFLESRSGPEEPERQEETDPGHTQARAGLLSSRQGSQPPAENRCAILEAQEAPRGAGTQPLAGNATFAVIRRDPLLALAFR